MAFVFLDHPLGLLGLSLVVRRLGSIVVFRRLFLHLLHLTFGFAYGPRLG